MSKAMETYFGIVRTPADAIKLFEACRLGLLPRVQRRLSEKERQAIRSGSVYVWDEREAGMRRWTDGKSWSASRVSGSFLTYREMEGKRGTGFIGSGRRGAGKTPDSGRGSDEDHDDGEPDGYRYKADGLLKQSFSITTSNGQHLHLISYFSRPQLGQPDLPQPTTDLQLRSVVPVKGMYPESSMNGSPGPAMTRAPMQQQHQHQHQQPSYPQHPPHHGPPPSLPSSQHPHQPPHHHPLPHHPAPPPHHHHHHHQHPAHHAPQTLHQSYPHPPPYGPGYSWPPTPVATPPYATAHGHYPVATPYPPPNHLPPPHANYPAPPPAHQGQAPPSYSSYDAAPYASHPPPPPQSTALAPLHPLPTHSSAAPPHSPPHPSPQGQPDAARSQKLAQAILIDPRLTDQSNGGHVRPGPLAPLPGLNHVTVVSGPSMPSHTTPPPRTLSCTPPPPQRTGGAEVEAARPPAKKSTLAALLHPAPDSAPLPETSMRHAVANDGSPRLSPGSGGAHGPRAMPNQLMFKEDTRALQVLNQKICL